MVETISFGTPTGSARIAAVAIAVFPDPPAPSTPSIRPSACSRRASAAAASAIVPTAVPRSVSEARSAPISPASSAAGMSGSSPCGGPAGPASATSTSTPASRSRARTNASSSPFVSSVPISRTVGTPSAPVAHGLVGALLGRPQHRVADLRRAVAVLQRRPVRRDVGVVPDRREQVVQLVHERVLPADHVPLRPPMLPERVVGLGHEHGEEARVALGVLELVQALEVEGERSLRAVDLPREVVLAPLAEARRLDRPDRAAREPHRRLEGVVDVAPWH